MDTLKPKRESSFFMTPCFLRSCMSSLFLWFLELVWFRFWKTVEIIIFRFSQLSCKRLRSIFYCYSQGATFNSFLLLNWFLLILWILIPTNPIIRRQKQSKNQWNWSWKNCGKIRKFCKLSFMKSWNDFSGYFPIILL